MKTGAVQQKTYVPGKSPSSARNLDEVLDLLRAARHAASTETCADAIVTLNLKDFPPDKIPDGIGIIKPADFPQPQ